MHCFLGYYQIAQLRKITVNIIMFVGFKIGRVRDNFYAGFTREIFLRKNIHLYNLIL